MDCDGHVGSPIDILILFYTAMGLFVCWYSSDWLLSADFYQNFSNFFESESWRQSGYFDILLNLLSPT